MKSFRTFVKTEGKLILRSPDMMIFSLLMPVVILVVVGLIYSGNEVPMVNLTFGAFISIGICAVGLMGLPLTLAEYRSRKVLKRLQVTPAHPGLLLGVQLVVQAAAAIVSALLVVAAALLFFDLELKWSMALVAGFFLVLVSIFSIGLVIASTARDVKRAGIICSLLYFPMLLFSGTTVPFPVFPKFLQNAAVILPLRHGIVLLNGLVSGDGFGDYWMQIGILGSITLVCTGVSLNSFRWDMDGV